MSKRQASKLMETLSKAARRDDTEEVKIVLEVVKKTKTNRVLLDLSKKETSDEFFRSKMISSSKQDRYLEFQLFRRNCPKLLPAVESELDALVKKELLVESVDVDDPLLHHDKTMPLLNALSNKIGLALEHILAPPTIHCLLCQKLLVKSQNPPVLVSLMELEGPSLATKYSWRCNT